MPTTVFVDTRTIDLDSLHALASGAVHMVASNTPVRLHRAGWEQLVPFHHIVRDQGCAMKPYNRYSTQDFIVWEEADEKNSSGFPLSLRYGGGNAYLIEAMIAENLPI